MEKGKGDGDSCSHLGTTAVIIRLLYIVLPALRCYLHLSQGKKINGGLHLFQGASMKAVSNISTFLLLMTLSTGSSAGFFDDNTKMGACLLFKCPSALTRCTYNKTCKQILDCLSQCKADNREEKQKCTIRCTSKDESTPFDAMMGCAIKKGCTPRVKQGYCAPPHALNISSAEMEKLLQGSWYVVRGLSRAYDCWPCQKMSFTEQPNGEVDYQYDYMPNPPQIKTMQCKVKPVYDGHGTKMAGRFKVSYQTHGFFGEDDWYIISRHSDYALIYYCGESPFEKYRGAVVMSRLPQTALPPEIAEAFKGDLQQLNIDIPVDINEFCIPEQTCYQTER
jgi:hypothetical protein